MLDTHVYLFWLKFCFLRILKELKCSQLIRIIVVHVYVLEWLILGLNSLCISWHFYVIEENFCELQLLK